MYRTIIYIQLSGAHTADATHGATGLPSMAEGSRQGSCDSQGDRGAHGDSGLGGDGRGNDGGGLRGGGDGAWLARVVAVTGW
jgi:hypothetical protein